METRGFTCGKHGAPLLTLQNTSDYSNSSNLSFCPPLTTPFKHANRARSFAELCMTAQAQSAPHRTGFPQLFKVRINGTLLRQDKLTKGHVYPGSGCCSPR